MKIFITQLLATLFMPIWIPMFILIYSWQVAQHLVEELINIEL